MYVPFSAPPPVNPLDGYKATWDLFYEFLKKELTKQGTLATADFIQLKVAAELLDANKQDYPWFSYFEYLSKCDLLIEPVPLSQQLSVTDMTLSNEYGQFLDQAIELVDEQQLDPKTLQQIADLNIERENIKRDLRRLTKEDLTNWKEVAEAAGVKVGDRTAYSQWSMTQGNLEEIGKLIKEKRNIEGSLARLHAKKWKDADEKEIKESYDAYVLEASRLRYPRRPDYEYPDGKSFNPVYLTTTIGPGDTALFADRHAVFPNMSLDLITGGTAGALSVNINQDSRATESMSTDWSGGGSASFGWFSLSGSAASNTSVKEEFSKTTNLTLSWKSVQIVPVANDVWFRSNLFKNKKILGDPGRFERFFGAQGTLLYYPRGLIVMRGFAVKFTSSQNWTYDYVHDFSAKGSGGFSCFGIGFGAGYSRHEHTEQHNIEKSGTELTFGDGDSTLRVVGMVVAKNKEMHSAIFSSIHPWLDNLFAQQR